jgi:hypothetical protein
MFTYGNHDSVIGGHWVGGEDPNSLGWASLLSAFLHTGLPFSDVFLSLKCLGPKVHRLYSVDSGWSLFVAAASEVQNLLASTVLCIMVGIGLSMTTRQFFIRPTGIH